MRKKRKPIEYDPRRNHPLAGDPPEDARQIRNLTPEPLWYLRGVSYGTYRMTEHWRLRRRELLEKAEDGGWLRCAWCGLNEVDEVEVIKVWYVGVHGRPVDGRNKYSRRCVVKERVSRQPRYDVHHLTYERLGDERDEDLQIICNPCHNLEHRPNSPAAKWWYSYLDNMGMLSEHHHRPPPGATEEEPPEELGDLAAFLLDDEGVIADWSPEEEFPSVNESEEQS